MLFEEHQSPDGVRPDRIRRLQVANLLQRAAVAPVTLLVGPAGSGKSDVVRAFLVGPEALYYRVGNQRRTFARFVHGLAQAVASAAPGAQASFPRAWERSLQSRFPPIALARWLCEHLDGIDANIVIDDLHDAAADTSIASFIARIAESRPNGRLTITARSVGALPVALWMATRQMQSAPIREIDLAFHRAEVAEAAQQVGLDLTTEAISEILFVTNGLPIAVAYALARLRHDPSGHVSNIPASFTGIAEEVFVRRTACEKNFLFNAALLPTIEDDLLRLLGWEDPEQTRAALGSDTAFMWEQDDHGNIRFHDRFRDYLEREFHVRDMDYKSTTAYHIVSTLTLAGQPGAALEVATRQPMIKAMGKLLDSHGFEILESGEIDVIREALAAVEESSLGATGLALRGYMEARSGHLDTAEAWFRLALDKAQDETSRATIAIYYTRELTKRRREDACGVLQEFATSTSLPRPVLIDVRSSLARALAGANRPEEARFHIGEALRLLDADSPPALRARVFERASFVALASGQPETAREYGLIAAPLAAAHSLYEVAASAYAALYNIAYDIDDDAVSTREYLNRHREMGVKSGILRADLFGMVALYELYAEAGDQAALAATNTQILALDTHDAVIYFMEAMIPSKALQAGWAGDFDDAQRLLKPTAERQATPVRRALCWAQVYLYCAAADNAQGAHEASRASQHALKGLEQHETRTTQHGLTLLNLALGALVSDDVESARRWTSSADDALIGHGRRLRALRAAIQAMIAGCDDPSCFAQGVAPALAALQAESFGGMAKLIEALPYPFTNSSEAKTTIGSVLAHVELSARFASAVAADDSALLRAWLDTAHGSTFRESSISTQFDRWASEHGRFHRRAREIGNMRRDLAKYHRPTPAVSGCVKRRVFGEVIWL